MTPRSDDGRPVEVDAELLRAWPVPQPTGSKRSRGDVLVVGGAARSPGAAVLAGRAALRVGAGRLTLALAASAAACAAVAFPESGVVPLEETPGGHVRGRGIRKAAGDLTEAGTVLVGPGLDDVGETRALLRLLAARLPREATLVLDAYALGAIGGAPRLARAQRRILTPNREEAGILLGRDLAADAGAADEDLATIARRYGAVVTCHSTVAAPDGRLFHLSDGGSGLGTSCSGDALAGAIAGLAARGCDPVQAAVWGTYLHAAAGRALGREIAPVGFLASEIVDRLPRELVAVEQR